MRQKEKEDCSQRESEEKKKESKANAMKKKGFKKRLTWNRVGA